MQLAIRADVFYRAVKSTAFAASRYFDARRPAFSGVLLDVSPSKFRAVATDGYRLALFESGDGHDCRKSATAILSARELVELKLPRASNAIFKITINDTEAVIQYEKAGFSVPVIQAPFPYYFDLFPPEKGSVTLHCEKLQFVAALIAARQKTTRKNRNIFFWAYPGCIALAAQDADVFSPVRMAAQCDSPAFGVLNVDYLRDAVQALPAGNIQIRFTPPDEGCSIRDAIELSPADQSHNVIRHLVMPCRLLSIPILPD